MGICPTQIKVYIFREDVVVLTQRSHYGGGNSENFSVKDNFGCRYVCPVSFLYQFCLLLRLAQYRKSLIHYGL